MVRLLSIAAHFNASIIALVVKLNVVRMLKPGRSEGLTADADRVPGKTNRKLPLGGHGCIFDVSAIAR